MAVFTEISSKDNPLIKSVSALQNSSKMRKEKGIFVMEGIRICRDANENGVKFDRLIVSEEAFKKYETDIELLSKNSESVVKIPNSLFKKISDTNSPQGVMALGYIPKNRTDLDRKGRYIALENISDPSNLGAVARTAEALGISGIIITDSSVDPYSPKVLRASMGTILRMSVFVCDDIIDFAKSNSLRTFGCVVDRNAAPITNIEFHGGDVLIIGNEANGICEKTKQNTTQNITIKMLGSAESLNAAAAAAIAMWEMMRAK